MNAIAVEAFLARLYTDEPLRLAFLAQPDAVLQGAGLDEASRQCLLQIDRDGLVLAAHSIAAKRAAHARPLSSRGWAARWRVWWSWRPWRWFAR